MMDYKLINASAHDTGIESESIDAVVTSPPYYSLRKYLGEQAIDWPAVDYSPMPGLPALHIEPMACELGLEPTPEAYIGHLILVMREMWRVLKPAGTAWVNLGDSYNGSGGAGGDYNAGGLKEGQPKYKGANASELKPKDLMLMPHRFALAAQADGWWVRSEIIWHKKAPMPESVTDRPTKAHEQIWLLTKSQRYYYDAEAIRERSIHPLGSNRGGSLSRIGNDPFVSGENHKGDPWISNGTRNKRDVWSLGPSPYLGAHFAVFPPVIPETCIKAGSSERGCCPECGSPWERIIERTPPPDMGRGTQEWTGGANIERAQRNSKGGLHPQPPKFLGWQPACACDAGDPVPATVLDPFVGSGTTVQAAIRLGRNAIGVDISQEYLTELVPERISNTQLVLI